MITLYHGSNVPIHEIDLYLFVLLVFVPNPTGQLCPATFDVAQKSRLKFEGYSLRDDGRNRHPLDSGWEPMRHGFDKTDSFFS